MITDTARQVEAFGYTVLINGTPINQVDEGSLDGFETFQVKDDRDGGETDHMDPCRPRYISHRTHVGRRSPI